jgi:hypothetical protein
MLSLFLLNHEPHWEGGSIAQQYKGGAGVPRLFHRITHVRLAQRPTRRLSLRYYDRLTHFALPYTGGGRGLFLELEQTMQKYSHLEVVVVLYMDLLSREEVEDVQKWVISTRMAGHAVYAVKSDSMKLEEEWEEEARGGPTLWERAQVYTESFTS